MSRTDVHRPPHVQLTDPHNRHIVRRDRDGEPTALRHLFCGCRFCTGQYGRRLSHRRERARWRAARQAALTTAPQDRDAIDAPGPRRLPW